MKSYKGMAITREGALKLIKALSEGLLKSDSEVLLLYEVDAPFLMFDEEGESVNGFKRRNSKR